MSFINKSSFSFVRIGVVVLAAGLLFALPAKTRWGTLQSVPSADMIPGDRAVIEADLFWTTDTFSFSSPVSVQRIHLGLSEWVNVDVGYAEGFTLGLKACFLKEGPALYHPTITIGAQNLYTSRERLYFGGKEGYPRGEDYPKNELYIAFAKSAEFMRLRMQAGVLTAIDYPTKRDRFNPFVGLEKYFGDGAYMTVEAQRRSNEILLSLFATTRVIRDRMEVSVGVVDLPGMINEKERKVILPGVRASAKFNIGWGHNSMDGLFGIEDRIDRQRDTLTNFRRELNALKEESKWHKERINALAEPPPEYFERRNQVLDELTKLRNLYDQIPFDPELVRETILRIKAQYRTYSPHLRLIITDDETPLRLRTLAVMLIGEMGDRSASAILISMLQRFEEPTLKIEIIIALGKLKETRSQDAIKALREDNDSAVALTAKEIYRTLFGGDELDFSTLLESSPSESSGADAAVEEDVIRSVPERRISE